MESKVAIPKDINLANTKPMAVPAYARRFTSLTTNAATFGPQNTVQITLDTSVPGAFIDTNCSYLEFDINVSGTTHAGAAGSPSTGVFVPYLMSSAGMAALIEDFRIFIQGVPIEEIRSYNNLAATLNDLHGQSSTYLVTNNYISSVNQYNAVYYPAMDKTTAANAAVVATTVAAPDLSVWSGNILYCGNTYRVQLPLISGVLGALSEKMFPSMLLAPGSVMIELRLASLERALQIVPESTRGAGPVYTDNNGTLTNFTLSRVRFVGKQIILQDNVSTAIIERAASGDISIHTQSYRNGITTITPGNTSSVAMLCSMKLASCNSLYFTFRDTSTMDNTKYNSFGRTCLGTTENGVNSAQVQLRVGNDFLPTQPMESSGEIYIEMLKAHHMFGDLYSQQDPVMGKLAVNRGRYGITTDYDTNTILTISGDVSVTNFMTDVNTDPHPATLGYAYGGNYSTFVLAFDTDTFSYDNNVMRSGRYLGNNTIYLQLDGLKIPACNQYTGFWNTGSVAPTSPTSVRVDFFALHDMRLSFQAGGVVQAYY